MARCKRHVAVGAGGLLLSILVHAADSQDANGLDDMLKRVKPIYNGLRVVFAASVYNRPAALLACFVFGLALIIFRSPAGSTGYVVQRVR